MKKTPLSQEHQDVRAWILNNRGVLQRIAEKINTTHQFVQLAAYQKTGIKLRPDHPVLRELRAAGWPGVK